MNVTRTLRQSRLVFTETVQSRADRPGYRCEMALGVGLSMWQTEKRVNTCFDSQTNMRFVFIVRTNNLCFAVGHIHVLRNHDASAVLFTRSAARRRRMTSLWPISRNGRSCAYCLLSTIFEQSLRPIRKALCRTPFIKLYGLRSAFFFFGTGSLLKG